MNREFKISEFILLLIPEDFDIPSYCKFIEVSVFDRDRKIIPGNPSSKSNLFFRRALPFGVKIITQTKIVVIIFPQRQLCISCGCHGKRSVELLLQYKLSEFVIIYFVHMFLFFSY